MFAPDASRIYSIVPLRNTVEDGLKIHSLLLPYSRIHLFEHTTYFSVTDEAFAEIEKQSAFTKTDFDSLDKVRSMRTGSNIEVYLFYVDDELVGAGEILFRMQNFGIVIRHDLQRTGLASFFAERFTIRFEDKIASMRNADGMLLRLAKKRKAMQNNIQQATA